MNKEQIRKIEEILSDYKYLGTAPFDDDYYIFQNRYSPEYYIAFSTDVQFWYSYALCDNCKQVANVSPNETRAINKIINEVLEW